MRPFPLAILLVLVVAAAPAATARHAGPCLHEYAEALRHGPDMVVATVESCVERDAGLLCEALDPCPLP